VENGTDLVLDQPLPADVVAAGNQVWSRYRRYPVFSRPWLIGRTRLVAFVVGAVSLVIGLGRGMERGDYALGLLGGLYLFVSFLLMTSMGPTFASWVRHRRWPLRRERHAIVAAVLIGMAASAGVDAWASSQLDRMFELSVRYGEAPPPPRLPGAAEKGVAIVVNIAVLAVIYALLGGGLALRTYLGEHRRIDALRQRQELAALRLRERQTEQRLALLQAQVEPHFLFNSLASIRALVQQSPRRAEAALDALVAYLRSTIPQLREVDGAPASTLGQQVDLCATYLELMQARMGERLSFTVDAPDALRGLPFPPLLLIGLVENAIKHGVEPQSGPGHVALNASLQSGDLHVRVSDDGVGIRAGAGGGLGLVNLREQLALYYGDRAGFSLTGLRERGTVAEIRVPVEIAA
jgi:signal transduction histidine kinase